MDVKQCKSILAAAFLAAAFAVGACARMLPADCEPPTSAHCAVVMDAASGELLFARRPHDRALIASTTKIMTGLLICESGQLDRAVTVPDAAVGVEGSSMYLRHGERLCVRDLLYGMMLQSGNDAAAALAIVHSGSMEQFVREMNRRAQALGLLDTCFANPHGLDSRQNYSTAADLALLTREALKNEAFRAAVSTRQATCAGRTLVNHNKLLWRVDGCIGVKTGYTKQAGRILVSAAQRQGNTVIVVTISDPDDWRDHAALLDYGFAALARRTPVYPQIRRVQWNSGYRRSCPHAASHRAERRRS